MSSHSLSWMETFPVPVPRRKVAERVTLITLGALVCAVATAAFLVPANIAGPGVTGIATILNNLMGTPVGLVVFLLNIPIMVLGYRMLGGLRAVLSSCYFVLVYSVCLELIRPLVGSTLVSDNILLMALFGGVLGGIGGGLVYRAEGTMGGTSTLARILQLRWGTPLSTTGIYTDGLVMLAAGAVFGWEAALSAMVALFIGGIASDYMLEGPSVVRTATIVTDNPVRVAQAITHTLKRGVTEWRGEGANTHLAHTVLFVTVARPEARRLSEVVTAADPNAFIVIGQGHAVYGGGFNTIKG